MEKISCVSRMTYKRKLFKACGKIIVLTLVILFAFYFACVIIFIFEAKLIWYMFVPFFMDKTIHSIFNKRHIVLGEGL